MGDELTLEEKIAKINFHLENGDHNLLEDPSYQKEMMSVAGQAIAQSHPGGEYLLSVVEGLQGDLSAAMENKLKAAMNGNSNAIMEYTNAVGHGNVTAMALLMARLKCTGSDTSSLYQDYYYTLEDCDEAFRADVTELAESIVRNLEKKGLKFSW